MRSLKHSLGLLFFCLIPFGVTGLVQALPATPPPDGITVSPGKLNFILDNKPSQTIPLTITNSYSSTVNLVAELKGIDENAGLLLPSGSPEPNISSALHLSQTDISLAAGQSQVVQVQVNDSPNLGPGGYYVSLVLTQRGTGNEQLPLNAAISLSLFILKPSGARVNLKASNLQTDGWLFSLPSTVKLDFNNSGNIHVIPRAVIAVDGRGGQELARGVANIDSLPLLPGKHLKSTVSITTLKRGWLPQHLNIAVTYRADTSVNTYQLHHSQWYIPPVDLLFLLIIAVVGYLAVIHRQRWLLALRYFRQQLRKIWGRSKSNKGSTKSTAQSIFVTDASPDAVVIVSKAKSKSNKRSK